MEEVELFYSKLEAAGIPKRYTHQLGEQQVGAFCALLLKGVN